MPQSTISITVDLDNKNIPERIVWKTSEKPDQALESKSFSLSLWDPTEKNTLRIDLWTKDMPIHEMKNYYIDCLSGLAQSVLTATNDEFIANELNNVCEKIAKHIEKDLL